MPQYEFRDLVRESALAIGLGDYALLGAVAGMFPFAGNFSDGAPLVYVAVGVDGDGLPATELAAGIYEAAENRVIRGQVLRSTHDDEAIDWGAGNQIIYCAAPALLQLFLDSDGVLRIPLTVSGQYAPVAVNSGTALTLDYANIVAVTLTGNASLTLPAMAASAGEEAQMVLEITQDGTGGRTVTLAAPGGATIKYGGGATGVTVLSGAGARTDILVRRRYGSTVYYVSVLDNWS